MFFKLCACVSVLICVYICMLVKVPLEAEEDIRLPGARVTGTGSSEPYNKNSEN